MSETISILESFLSPQEAADFREFVVSPEFCNNKDMYEFWLSNGEALPKSVSELLIDGSLGGGKTWFANYYLAFRVYRLFLAGNPQKQLGLAEDSEIFGFYFTVSMDLAKTSGFLHLYNIFKNNKWFRQNYPIDTNLKSVISFIDQNFYIKAGSDFGHQLGLNVWCFILDEANFRNGVGEGMAAEYEEVTELYQQLTDRQLSRMSNADGTINALAILISSASYQTSFMEKRKQLTKDDPNAVNITAVAYEVRPDKYPKERFRVFIGAGAVEPAIIENEDQEKLLLQKAALLGTGQEEQFFRMVPINLKRQFEQGIVLALQNHCGVATMLQGSFMVNLKYLYDSYTDDTELPYYFQSEVLEASTKDDTELIEYFIPENVRYPERPHSLFLDASIQGDTASLVCVRYDGLVNNKDMHSKVFELKIIPPKFPAATRLTKLQRLIIDLAYYINIVAVGSDQFQSAQIRQEVQAELKIDDIRVSIDSSDIPHIIWSRILVEGRLRQRKSELLEREVQEAVHDYKKHRVLKAKGSTDDTMQANVGATFLSETFGKTIGTIDDLYPESRRINLVGGKSMIKVLKECGYQA